MKYFSIIVVAIMVIFAIIGIIDTVFLKDKLGYGAEFKKGMEMIGPLCLAIVGIIALVPEIKWVLEKTLTPLYTKLGFRSFNGCHCYTCNRYGWVPTCQIGCGR